jgi:hypothetical protein
MSFKWGTIYLAGDIYYKDYVMDVYINQLKRIIDRIIMPQYPELRTYKLEVKEKNGFHYMAVIYIPKEIKRYNDWENQEEDKWKNIATQTRRYYDATGHDEHYLLGAVGEIKAPAFGHTSPGTTPPIHWWWKLNSEVGWKDRRDRNATFYNYRRWENDINQNT